MLKKQVLKSKPTTKVRFSLGSEEAGGAEKVFLSGDFNGWDTESHPMKRSKNGSFSLELDLPRHVNHRFRYYLGDNHWANDTCADGYEFCGFADADNFIVKL